MAGRSLRWWGLVHAFESICWPSMHSTSARFISRRSAWLIQQVTADQAYARTAWTTPWDLLLESL